MKARRIGVVEMPNSSASPAHTPAIFLPRRRRYHSRISGEPPSELPQYRHLVAESWIVSAQYGQFFIGVSLTPPPVAHRASAPRARAAGGSRHTQRRTAPA